MFKFPRRVLELGDHHSSMIPCHAVSKRQRHKILLSRLTKVDNSWVKTRKCLGRSQVHTSITPASVSELADGNTYVSHQSIGIHRENVFIPGNVVGGIDPDDLLGKHESPSRMLVADQKGPKQIHDAHDYKCMTSASAAPAEDEGGGEGSLQ